MAQINFSPNNNSNRNSNNNLDLTVKINPGEGIFVRFLHDTPNDFDRVSTHLVTLPGAKYGRRVECLRTPEEPLDNCPLCAAGIKQEIRMYVHMIQYTVLPDGTVKAEPKVWDRPSGMAFELSSKMNTYKANGQFSRLLFKINRIGAGPSDTRYSIDYMGPLPQNYPLAEEEWEKVAYPHIYLMRRDAQDMVTFLETGNFPAKTQNAIPSVNVPSSDPVAPAFSNDAYSAPVHESPVYPAPPQSVYQAPVRQEVPTTSYANATPTMPYGNETGPVKRFY